MSMRRSFRIDIEKIEGFPLTEVERYDDISRIESLHGFMFASEERISGIREKNRAKSKLKRVKELFGENIVVDELDLDYEFQQLVERLRREMFLQENEGVVEVTRPPANHLPAVGVGGFQRAAHAALHRAILNRLLSSNDTRSTRVITGRRDRTS